MASNGNHPPQNPNGPLPENEDDDSSQSDAGSHSYNTIGRALIQLVDDMRTRRHRRRRRRNPEERQIVQNILPQESRVRQGRSPVHSYIPLEESREVIQSPQRRGEENQREPLFPPRRRGEGNYEESSLTPRRQGGQEEYSRDEEREFYYEELTYSPTQEHPGVHELRRRQREEEERNHRRRNGQHTQQQRNVERQRYGGGNQYGGYEHPAPLPGARYVQPMPQAEHPPQYGVPTVYPGVQFPPPPFQGPPYPGILPSFPGPPLPGPPPPFPGPPPPPPFPGQLQFQPGGGTAGPSGTPLTWRLKAEPIPTWFKQPNDMKAFDGSSDPREFITVFRASMSLCGKTDSLLCRTFPVFLRKQALEWFTALPDNSIDSWADLSSRFTQQFIYCGPQPKTTHNLCGVRQKPGEKLREYYERFQAEARQVRGLENQTYLLLFTTGLQPGGIANSLAKKKPNTKEELLERIRKYIDLEEFRASQKEIERGFKEANQSKKLERPAGRERMEERQARPFGDSFRERFRSEFTPLNTSRAQILKEVMNTEMRNVSRPPPIRSVYAQAD